MKKIINILAGAAAVVALAGCSESYNMNEAQGEGRLLLRAHVEADMNKVSRAMSDADADSIAESCQIWITTGKGLVRKYEGIANLPQNGVWLAGGTYKAYAWAGDSVPASFDKRFFKGVEPFEIGAGQTIQVNLACRVANVAVSVKYSEAVDNVLTDYVLTVGHDTPNGTLAWNGRDERRGYFMMNSRNTDLKYTLTGKAQDGSTFTKEGTIPAVKAATEYVLNVDYQAADLSVGGGYFTIDVDENPISTDTQEIVILGAPQIMSIYQPITETVYGEVGNVGRQKIYVTAAAELQNVEISLPEELVGEDYTLVNLVGANATVMEYLASKGLNTVRERDVDNDTDALMINLESEMLSLLPEGEHAIGVKATIAYDDNGKTMAKSTYATMNIKVSDALVGAEPIDDKALEIYTNQATLTAKVMKDGAENVGFNYRAKGASDWTFVAGEFATSRAAQKGTTYTAVITGLNPATTYEYCAAADGYVSADVMTFTTEAATQLPNAGFEEWQTSKAPYLIYAAGTDMFWDSGNHGSATMSKNVTVPGTEYKHSGNYSIKLASQFVGVGTLGKFAAGNVFIGKYLATEGTDGVLGWGRPFNSRPVALKGYVKYEPVAITHVGSLPSALQSEYVKGQTDKGIIYIALLDGSKKQGDGGYPEFPVVIKTKTSKLFNPEADDVVAYGEVVFSEATPGSDMVEFTVNLEYKRTDVKPTYIMCTASASKGGDYFTGGNGSTMYIDDLELVY